MLAAAFAAGGCAALCGVAPEPVVVHVADPDPGCLAQPPPREAPVRLERGGACPAAFAGCLGPEAAAALAGNLEALRRYGEGAWTTCGNPDGGADGGGGGG